MYKRIILAYDGSIESRSALREGALLAKRYSAQVFLLSVIVDSVGVIAAEGAYPGVWHHQEKAHLDLLAEGARRLDEFGISAVSKLVRGEPAKVIGATAREVKADLVVVGHRPKNLLSRWWSGSTGGYLSDHIGCSLLIARRDITDEAFEAEVRRLDLSK